MGQMNNARGYGAPGRPSAKGTSAIASHLPVGSHLGLCGEYSMLILLMVWTVLARTPSETGVMSFSPQQVHNDNIPQKSTPSSDIHVDSY